MQRLPRLSRARILCALTLSAHALCLWSGNLTADDVSSCEPEGEVTPICGFHHPEDLEVMPGERLILVSEYGSLDGSKPGALSSYRPDDGYIETLYPSSGQSKPSPAEQPAVWGDPACPGPPTEAFDPHGIHHSVDSGAARLLVVNHGGRESIEMFEVKLADDGRSADLYWRGCVVAPVGAWLNDVVGLPDRGLVATHMMARGTTSEALGLAARSNSPTGYALEWQPGSGWRQLPGTEGTLNNGIEVSADGTVLYINYYLGDEVVAVERQSGTRLWQASVPQPDNLSWAPDSRLLVASHQEDLDAVIHCSEHEAPVCPIRYAVVSIDSATGTQSTVITGGGAVFGGATVAVQIDQFIYLGSFTGNRMALRRLQR